MRWGHVVAVALLASGCTLTIPLLPIQDALDSPGDGSAAVGDAAAVTCAPPGPPIHLGGDDPAHCAGAIAARALRHALCSCESLVVTRPLLTDSFDSTSPGPLSRRAAAIGTDGEFRSTDPINVGGSLIAAGGGGIDLGRMGAIAQSLRSGGRFGTQTTIGVTVSGDAWSAGDVDGIISINGTLRLPAAAAIGPRVVARKVSREPVMVPPPCDCAAGPRVDPAALVAERAAANDNARLPFEASALATIAGTDGFDFPCGQYYLPALVTPRNAILELRIHGRVGLFVAGEVSLAQGANVVLDPGAELDLVVAGNFSVAGGTFGPTSGAAARVRLWLASRTLKLTGGARLNALVHAPQTVLSASSTLIASGALLVQAVSVSGEFTVHFDRALLAGGTACGLPTEKEIP